MSTETLIILLTFVLAMAYYYAPSIFKARRATVTDLLGSRDNIPPAEGVMERRAERAMLNFKETLPWAIAFLILVQVTGDANGTTALGGWVYLICRALYLPIYLMGTPYVRSLVWMGSMIGLIMVAVQLM